MIDLAMRFVTDSLNAYFTLASNQATETVVLSSLVKPDGSVPPEITNKAVFCLINLEQETTFRNQSEAKTSPSSALRTTTPISLNLHVMFSANYNHYPSSLNVLSRIVAYLQDKPVFNHQNSPGLDPGIEKLIFDMLKLDYSQMSHLWGGLGAKYVPSAIYRMRMVTLGGNQIEMSAAPVSSTPIN
jgi:hypothetical protein